MDVNVEATVERVTVYPDRARVTAVGQTEVEVGQHRLLIDGLPLLLEQDSVRVTGQGSARVRIQSVDVARHFYEEAPAARVQELELAIEQLSDELEQLNNEKARWTAQGEYIEGLRQSTVEFAKGLSRGRTTVEDQAQLLAFLHSQDAEMHTAVHGLNQQERQLKKRLQKLQNELKQLRSARPRERFQAVVDVQVLTAGTFQPELSYVVSGASWQPLYDIRLANHKLEVTYIAQISQHTGQDWQGVTLSVSTARPSLNQRLPELQPWFLDVYVPPPPSAPAPMRKRAMLGKMATTEASDDEDLMILAHADMSFEAVPVMASSSSEGTAVTFHVPNGADIPSDGSPHKTTLQQFELTPKLDYLCAPKHTDAVYRRATAVNSSAGPLLAGNASLFVDHEFIGRTQLGYTPSGGEIELLLGVEERITVERQLKRRDVDKKMLRDVRRTRYGYEIELHNLLATAAAIEVHDHIPVSRSEQIKIKLEVAKPSPTEQSELNLLEWHLTLAAQAKQTLSYEFVVEHAPALQISGLQD